VFVDDLIVDPTNLPLNYVNARDSHRTLRNVDISTSERLFNKRFTAII
jgi:hypothetical protein